jgi:hypothetical protein
MFISFIDNGQENVCQDKNKKNIKGKEKDNSHDWICLLQRFIVKVSNCYFKKSSYCITQTIIIAKLGTKGNKGHTNKPKQKYGENNQEIKSIFLCCI